MAFLLAAGAACALVAFFIVMRAKDKSRMQQMAALFVAMLGLSLAQFFPPWSTPLGGLSILAAAVYAFLAVRGMKRQQDNGGGD